MTTLLASSSRDHPDFLSSTFAGRTANSRHWRHPLLGILLCFDEAKLGIVRDRFCLLIVLGDEYCTW